MSNVNQIIIEFNCILLDLAKNIATICPDSIIGRNIKDIDKVLRNSEHKSKFIDVFVTKILPYKKEIDAGNDDFFMSKTSYDEDFEGYESWTSKVFEFKSIWGKLKRDNKDLVIQFMQILCQLAQNYFIIILEQVD